MKDECVVFCSPHEKSNGTGATTFKQFKYVYANFILIYRLKYVSFMLYNIKNGYFLPFPVHFFSQFLCFLCS